MGTCIYRRLRALKIVGDMKLNHLSLYYPDLFTTSWQHRQSRLSQWYAFVTLCFVAGGSFQSSHSDVYTSLLKARQLRLYD
jgi:hypothetical protein